jgi:hypothetical protein
MLILFQTQQNMRMKIKFLLVSVIVGGGLMFTSCGNDKAQKEAEAQRIADSIRMADSIHALEAEAQRVADSIAAAAAMEEESSKDDKTQKTDKKEANIKSSQGTSVNVAPANDDRKANTGGNQGATKGNTGATTGARSDSKAQLGEVKGSTQKGDDRRGGSTGTSAPATKGAQRPH